MKLTPIYICDADGLRDGRARLMYEAEDGLRFTPEQAKIVEMCLKIEKKMDVIVAALEMIRG